MFIVIKRNKREFNNNECTAMHQDYFNFVYTKTYSNFVYPKAV